jgi:hypothetical protein
LARGKRAAGARVRLQSRVLTLLLSPSDLDGMFPSLSTFAGALRTRQWLRKDPEAEVDPAFGRPFQLSLSTQPSLTSLCYNRTTHAPTLGARLSTGKEGGMTDAVPCAGSGATRKRWQG